MPSQVKTPSQPAASAARASPTCSRGSPPVMITPYRTAEGYRGAAASTPTRLAADMQAPWTVRVAAWSARHRWLVFLLWVAATLGTLGASFAIGGIESIDSLDDPNGPRLESELAYEVLGAGEPVAASERL